MFQCSIEEFENKDAKEVTLMFDKVFNKFIANDLSPEGLIESLKNNKIFIAKVDSKIVGVIRVKEMQRITMFYVDENYQGLGIGKKLMSKVIELFKSKNIKKSFLKSSLFAIPIYEKLGFIKNGDLKKDHGLVYQEMVLNL